MRKDTKAKLAEIQAQHDIDNFESGLTRARSITVGTAFGGTTEITMRGGGGKYLYCVMQPVEVIELLHQLAANTGCHVYLKPRDDFASWRNWRVSETEKTHLNGFPPFVNDMAPHMQVGASLPPPEQQPGLNITAKEQQNVVATKKTVDRRSTKRTTKTA